ncbi:hypothetical protein OB981_26265 [Bacillus cereus]|nr:hypothetical protein [Bacillus cereus]
MKYKSGIQVKNSFKKSLFVTATAITLGISTFGGSASVFAAEYVIPIVDPKTLEQSPEDSQERIKNKMKQENISKIYHKRHFLF